VEKHPGDAQPLTQLCSPSQAQPFIVVPNVGRVLQAQGMKGAGSSSGSKWSPLRVVISDVEIENHPT